MLFKTKVSSSLAAALMLAGSSIPAHAMTAAADSARQDFSRFKQVHAATHNSESVLSAEQPTTRDRLRMQLVRGVMAAHGTAMQTASLYSAVPASVISTSETLMETAMGPGLRLGEPEGKALWFRLSGTDMRYDSRATMRSRAGQLSDSARLDQKLATAVIGGTLYANHSTRLDATFGMSVNDGRVQGNGPDPKLTSYSGSVGLILEHRTPIGLDLRLGTHVLAGVNELKEPCQDRNHCGLKEKFMHKAMGIRAEAAWGLPVGNSFMVTPRLGVSTNMARIRQNDIKNENHHNTAVSAATRLAYMHQMKNGRAASFWAEPAYVAQFKRTTHINSTFAGLNFKVSNRLPGDSAGVRFGSELPVGRNGSVSVNVSRFWGLNSNRQSENSANFSYAHRF